MAIKVFDMENLTTRQKLLRIKSGDVDEDFKREIKYYQILRRKGKSMLHFNNHGTRRKRYFERVPPAPWQTSRISGSVIFTRLITGLKNCHDNNIVHGDIKCDNCLLNKEGNLKIADFGKMH